MGGGGGVAEGAAAEWDAAPEAKRETPRWDGIGVARSRKKGDCRALRPRREAARECEEDAIGGRGGVRRRGVERVWASGFGPPFPSCWPCWLLQWMGALVGGRRADGFCLVAAACLYWAAALCLARLEIGTGQPEFTLTCGTFNVLSKKKKTLPISRTRTAKTRH